MPRAPSRFPTPPTSPANRAIFPATAGGGLTLSPPPEPPQACKATRLANVTACPVKRAKFIHFKVDSLVCGRQAKIGLRLLHCIHGNWAWEPSPEQVCCREYWIESPDPMSVSTCNNEPNAPLIIFQAKKAPAAAHAELRGAGGSWPAQRAPVRRQTCPATALVAPLC